MIQNSYTLFLTGSNTFHTTFLCVDLTFLKGRMTKRYGEIFGRQSFIAGFPSFRGRKFRYDFIGNKGSASQTFGISVPQVSSRTVCPCCWNRFCKLCRSPSILGQGMLGGLLSAIFCRPRLVQGYWLIVGICRKKRCYLWLSFRLSSVVFAFFLQG